MAGTIDSAADRLPISTVVVIAARDEADRIVQTLAGLMDGFPDAVVWVADDGSSDATSELARGAGARVVRLERTLGKGAAVTRAAERALEDLGDQAQEAHAPVFILCDGDLAASASRLAPLRGCVARGEADVAVAVFARSVGGGLGIAKGFARWAIERRCGLRTRAPVSGQRAISREALLAVLPLADGFGMEIGMTVDAVRAGFRVREIELDLAHRATGRSIEGFFHRGRQLIDFMRVYLDRR